jgi:hypothetical protein
MQALIIKMLHMNPECRPTAAEILLPRSFYCSTCVPRSTKYNGLTFLSPAYLQRTTEDVPAITITHLQEEYAYPSASHIVPGSEVEALAIQLLSPLGHTENHGQRPRLYRAPHITVSSTRSSSSERDVPDLTLSPLNATVSSATVASPNDADFLHEVAIKKTHDDIHPQGTMVADSTGEGDISDEVSSTASPQTPQELVLQGLTEPDKDDPWNHMLLLDAAEEPNVDRLFTFNRLEPVLIMPLSRQKRPTWPPRFMEDF